MFAPTFEGVLCEKAQIEFDKFCTIPIVPIGQLYGGKICAALARQHPRDLFDIKNLLNTDGFSEEIKKGFLLGLLGSDRSIHEIISPNILNQQSVLENQFEGMTDEIFTYDEFKKLRIRLITTIQDHLTEYDRKFLLDIMRLEPDWSQYPFQYFPSVRWKLRNIEALKEMNEKKYRDHLEALAQSLLMN